MISGDVLQMAQSGAERKKALTVGIGLKERKIKLTSEPHFYDTYTQYMDVQEKG